MRIRFSALLFGLVFLGIFSACKPSGKSSVTTNFRPFLQPPGAFSFSRIDATDGTVTLRWNVSQRATSYVVSWGSTAGTFDQITCEGAATSCEITGLSNNTPYYFTVSSTNSAGSRTVNATATGRPVGSFSVTGSTPNDGAANLTWSNSIGATSYTVRVGTTSGNYTRTITGVSSPYTVTGLSNGVPHFIQVSAVNAENGRFDAPEVSVTPIGPPSAPANLSAAASPNQIDLSWDAVTGATSYKIFRGTSSGSYTQIATGVATNSYVDGGAVNGTAYYYVVRANNGVFDSTNSNEATAKPVSAFTLSSASLAVVNSVDLTWASATGADSYNVIYGTTTGTYTATVTGVTSPYRVTGLSGGTTYYFRVVAKNNVGSGVQLNSTNELSATPVGLIGAPTTVAVTANPGQAILTWSAVSGAASYIVRRGTTSGSYTTIANGVGGTTYTDTTVSDGTTYYYIVQSFNGVPSVDSTEVSVRSISTFAQTSAVANSSTSIVLTWPVTAGAATYDIQYGTASGTYGTTITSATSPRTITGLTSNTRYYFRVVARNAVGTGTSINSTNELSALTPTAAPTGLLATATTGQIQLAWIATPGAINYEVFRGTTSGSYTSIATNVAANSYTDSTVTNGTTYYYVVRASNGSDSANSNESSARAIATLTIASVVTQSANSIQVSWSTPSGAASFDLKYGTVSGTYTSTLTGVSSPLNVTGLSPNTNYYFQLIAKNAVGGGASVNSTNEASALTSFGAPSGLIAIGEANQNYISWTPVSGATSYHLLRGTTSGSYTTLNNSLTVANFTDTTAVNGTTYYYVVRASNGTESANSTESSARPIANFTASTPTSVTASSMSVAWGSATGAASYDLRYGTSPGVYTTTLTGVTSPRSITGLASNTTYYFQVVAKNAVGGGASVNSTNEVSAITALGAPSGLTAQAGTGQITLNWTAVSGATSYHVLRGTTSGGETSLISGVSTNSYVDSTAANGTTYYYVVRSNNGSDSVNSSEVLARPISTFNITTLAVNSSSSLTVTWPAVSGAASYDVRIGTTSGTYGAPTAGVTSPYVITGLSSNTTYYVMITAKNAVGSGHSVNANSEASATTSFGAPSGLVATATTSQVSLTWTAVPGASTYHVLRGTTSGTYSSLNSAVTSNAYNDTTAVNGTTYYYVVRASNGTDSANSSEASARPVGTFSISAPSSISATGMSVSWGASTGATSYDLKYGTSSGSYLTTITNATSPYVLTGLSSNTTYYFMVVAKNAVGGGASLNANAEVNAKTSLGAPTGLTATASTSLVALSWSAVAGATSYHVLRGTTSGSYTSLNSSVLGTSFNDTTAANGTTYYYVVRANNGTDSANSNEALARPIANFAISSAAVNSATQITLTWAAAAGAATYDVKYGTTSGTYTTTLTNQTSPLSITGLTSGTTYFFMVTAKNSVGSGNAVDANAEASATTSLGAPTGVTATATTARVTLSWSAVSGASSYHVLRGTSSGSYTSLQSGITGTSYADTTAANGTTYFYVVRANNGSDSVNSAEVIGQPIASFAITSAVPTSSTTIDVTWPAVTGATTYDLKYGTSSGSYSTTLTGATSPRTLTGLSANTTYYFMVVAKNSVGAGASVNANAELSATTTFGAPSGLTAVATTGQVSLSWAAVSGATSYHILRGTTSGSYSSLQTGVTTNSYTDTTAVNGTTYYYVVRANNGTDSANSNEASGRPIAAFTIASTTATSTTSVSLSWNAATGAASYDVSYGTSSGSYPTTLTNQTSPLSITGLTSGQTYYFMVTARNAIGSGAAVNATAESSVSTPLGAPGGVTAIATTAQIALNWSAVAGATHYNIYRGTTSGSYASLISGVTGTSYTDTSAINGTTYYYVIRTFKTVESANSSEVSGRPIASFATTSVVANSASQITVTWPAVTGAANFDVKYGTTSGSYSTTLTNQTSPLAITGLSSGQTYYVMVTAKNAVGTGATVNANAELSATTSLGAPSGLTAQAGTGQVSLSWTAVAGATSYHVLRGTTSGSHTSLMTGITGTTYTDTTPVNGTTYFYVVRSNNGTDSVSSSEVSGRPIAAFTIASAVASSSSQINVTWNTASGASSYDLKYGTVSGSYGTTLTGVTSPYSVTGLASGQTYYFMVVAKNAVGSGNSVNATTEASATTAVGAPSGLTATATTSQVVLSWSAVFGATSYHVLRGTTTGSYSSLQSGVAGTSFTDTTALNGTTYFYVVRSNNGADSVNSAEVSARPISSFSLSTLVASSSTSLTVSWAAATGAASYDVRYGPSSGNYTGTATGVTSPYLITGLTAGQTYYVTVVAKNAVGTGASVNATNELNAPTSTAAPSGLTATASTAQIALSWTGVAGATSYNIYRGTTSGSYSALQTAVSTNSYTDSSAINGTTYFYVVRAFNGSESANSNEATAKPIASFAMTSATAASASTVSVVWPAVTGADSFDVKYGTTTGSYSTTVSGTTSPQTITGLTAGQTYYFRVVAKNGTGTGASINSTNEISATTAVGAPTGVVATASTGQVALSWSAVGGATSYNVYRGITSGSYSSLTTGVTGTTFTDSTAVNGTTYFYVIRSTNGTESVNSSEVSARPISAFTIASVVTTGTTTATLTWNAATGAASYDVKYGTTSGSYGTTLTNQTSPLGITGLSAGTTYYFMVTAKNAVGTGASVNATTEVSTTTQLPAPTGVSATATASQIALSWSAVSGATTYNVYRGTTSGSYASLITGLTSTTHTDTTAVNGTSYFYVIRAVKSGVESTNSSEVSGQPIAPFTMASATATSATAVSVAWNAATGAASYDLRYGTVSGTYSTTVPNVTTPYSVTGLTAGQTYYFRIVARNAVGTGASVNSTNELSAATSALPVISSITNKTMESDGSIAVTFTISDVDNTLNCSTSMSKTSSNTSVVPTASIVFSGSAPNCTATITPTAATTGTSTITLTVTDGTTQANSSFNLTVTPCVVASINWETQPTGMVAGNLFGTAPRVSLRKADNSLCMTNLSPVMIDVANDGSTQQDATVTATNSVTPSGGYALFNAARMTRAGTGHTLVVSQGSVLSAESNSFNVTATTASTLAWEVHPPTYDRLSVLTPNPVVRVADTYGNYTNTNAVSITVALMNNTSGATFGGTKTRSSNTSGAATFNNLTVSTPQVGYFMRATATGYTQADSNPFDILDISPQDTVSVTEMLGSAIDHSVGGNVNYLRGLARFSNADIDGTTTWTFEVVATNPGTAASTVRLRRGNTNIAAVTVPASSTNSTYYSTTIPAANISATRSTYRLRVEGGNAIVTTARVVAVQTNASRSVVAIPLMSIPTTATNHYYDTTSTTYSALPAEMNSTWVWDSTKLGRVNGIEMYFSYRSQSTANGSCVQLFNKTTNTAIGAERCNTVASETVSSITTIYPGVTIPDGTIIEARVRSTVAGQFARFYNIQMNVYLVNIENMLNIQRVVGARTGLLATTNFPEHRARDRSGSFGIAVVDNFMKCSAKATTSGSATFVMRDHNANTSGTTSTSNITASNATYSSQASFTDVTAGPFAGTAGEYVFAGFDLTSGTFDVNSCLWITQAAY